jgi:hypothetical protein
MGRSLIRAQEWAADRCRFVPLPRLYRVVRPRRDWLGATLKVGLFGWAMGLIWAPVGLGVLVAGVWLLGTPQ